MLNKRHELTNTVKQKSTNNNILKKIAISGRFVAVFIMILALFGGGSRLTTVFADQFDEKIQQLSEQNDKTSSNLEQLGSEASDLEDAIAKLQKQINTLQSQIIETQSKIDNLEKDIRQAQKELDKQRSLLGLNIREMYVEGDISTLEMLASSKDLSEFIDKQQYRNSVQSKIKETLDQVNELRNQLKDKKDLLAANAEDLKTRQASINESKSEQASLLGLNQSQQNQLDSKIKKTNSEIAKLRAQQAAANAVLFGGNVPTGSAANCGGYPKAWCHAPMDSIIDTWGMYNRECVSYTAWKVWSVGKHMPYWGGIGNANQWDENARAAGLPVNNNPNGVGVVAISNSGFYGHAMYVEHVYGDGTIFVSQYNAGLNGYYSTARISTAGLVFIHF
ncbi:MAG TPA: CHAP domain-containing protein [Candidatus Saccharibacteria bacterium]|nr:CHAP domain-containing protein [Candidatus Saccharibacteria bacterium]